MLIKLTFYTVVILSYSFLCCIEIIHPATSLCVPSRVPALFLLARTPKNGCPIDASLS